MQRMMDLAAGYVGSMAVVTLSEIDADTLRGAATELELSTLLESPPRLTGVQLVDLVDRLTKADVPQDVVAEVISESKTEHTQHATKKHRK